MITYHPTIPILKRKEIKKNQSILTKQFFPLKEKQNFLQLNNLRYCK